ncbi:hypothetical protein Tco_1377418 [Tanacetum coccineum]
MIWCGQVGGIEADSSVSNASVSFTTSSLTSSSLDDSLSSLSPPSTGSLQIPPHGPPCILGSSPGLEISNEPGDKGSMLVLEATNKGDAPAKPPQIITTNTLSNIKLPVLQKDDYDTWAMEMEHYLEYIDNEVWKVIQNGNSKKRVTKGKDVYTGPPSNHTKEQRFPCMDDAKRDFVAAIKTRFGGNANSKKMQKAILKQQFEAFTITSKESLEKGYDRFQKLLSQLDALGAGVSDEDANHKFLRSLPPAWDSLAMTMRTKRILTHLSIDDL